ncbi:hypothetical protein JG688_00013254 [Phytophthora aleatoria]|uniref:RxLR effector protein n=1 Tax=Phytophthora aleatoria TaxID=2496075 RepID=A0A8J5I9I5_9STRA|nr:hypothetical protein JG688_00013254 [Phytophthora aleatoria]
MFNKESPDKTISLIGTLSARYGDDAVANALVSVEMRASSIPQVTALAKQLRTEQLSAWLDSGKSVDDVFELLKLRQDGYKALESPKLDVLDDYIAKFNAEKGGHETILKTFTRGLCGESNLMPFLEVAKLELGTLGRAMDLEKKLLRQWAHDNLEPVDVMKLLKLDDKAETVFTTVRLKIFEKYLAEFNKKNSTKRETLLGVLTSKFGEAEVATAVVWMTLRGSSRQDWRCSSWRDG